MKIKRTCFYRTSNYNLLPAILLSIKSDGFIVAFKFICFHAGIYILTN